MLGKMIKGCCCRRILLFSLYANRRYLKPLRSEFWGRRSSKVLGSGLRHGRRAEAHVELFPLAHQPTYNRRRVSPWSINGHLTVSFFRYRFGDALALEHDTRAKFRAVSLNHYSSMYIFTATYSFLAPCMYFAPQGRLIPPIPCLLISPIPTLSTELQVKGVEQLGQDGSGFAVRQCAADTISRTDTKWLERSPTVVVKWRIGFLIDLR